MNLSSTEARLRAQERRPTEFAAHIEELAQDTDTSIRHLSQTMDANFREVRQDMHIGFEQAFAYVQERFDKIEATLSEHRERFDTIKRTMATKEDITALKATQDEQGQKLDLILQLLQRSGE